MAMHATIDPVKAVRWERDSAVRTLLLRVGLTVLVIGAGFALRQAATSWKDARGTVSAEVIEAAGPDGQSTIRYVDPTGATQTRRVSMGPVQIGEVITVRVSADNPSEPLAETDLTSQVVGILPWVVMVGGLVPLLGVPPAVLRIEKSGRARKVLEMEPIKATFDWHREQGGRREYRARVAPTEDVWKERMIYLGNERPDLDPDTYQVKVIGEVRGTEPLIVVGDSWSYVVLR